MLNIISPTQLQILKSTVMTGLARYAQEYNSGTST